MQDLLARHIAEVDVVKDDVTLDWHVLKAVFGRHLPLPGILDTRLFFNSHLAVVDFDFFIQNLENPPGPGNSQNDGVQLLGDLGDRHDEGLGQLHEGSQGPQGQRNVAG